MKKAFLFFIFLVQAFISVAQWHQANGPYGGSVKNVVATDSVVYAAIDNLGVYSSNDSGKTWKPVGLNYNYITITAFALAGNMLVASTSNGLFIYNIDSARWITGGAGLTVPLTCLQLIDSLLFAGDDGINGWVSADTGKTWTKLSIDQGVECYAHIGDTIFAGLAGYTAGVYFSTDNGQTWQTTQNNGLSIGFGIRHLAVSGDTLYAAAYGTGLYMSLDRGVTWTQTSYGVDPIYSILIEGNTFYVGDYLFIRKSSNRGATWNGQQLYYGSINGLAKCRGYLFAASAMGIFISADNGVTWGRSNKGIEGESISDMAVYGNTILAGTAYDIFSSADGGMNYSIFDSATAFDNDMRILVNGNTILLATLNGMLTSTDGGVTWSTYSTGYTQFYCLAAINDTIFAGAIDGVYKSTDNGLTWLKTAAGPTYAHAIMADGQTLYATGDLGIYRSADGGNTWVQLVNSGYFNSFDIAKANGNIFVGNGSNVTGGSVSMSADSGATWVNRSTGLRGQQVEHFAVNGSNIYVGTDSGLFVSGNNGASWTDITGNMRPIGVNAILIKGDSIYAGTINHSVWIAAVTCLQPFTVTGVTDVCAGSGTTLTASGAFNYVWQPTNLADSVINIPQVDTTTVYTVMATSVGGCTVQTDITIHTHHLVVENDTIHGFQRIQANSTQTYTIAIPNDAQSFVWAVPTGWVIDSGQGTNSIMVTADTTSGIVSVTINNICGGVTRQIPVTVSPCGAYYNIVSRVVGTTTINNESWGVEPIQYTWTWGDGKSSTGANPSHFYGATNEEMFTICLSLTDADGCNASYCDSLVFLAPTLVNISGGIVTAVASVASAAIEVFPNPSADYITVTSPLCNGSTTITLTDMTGRIVEQQQLNVSNGRLQAALPVTSGIYILHLVNKQTSYTAKVVKE